MATAGSFDRLAELERSGEPFALAMVIGRRAPVSAALGARAVIFPDGRMEGFVGGACARDIVHARALSVLRSGRPILLSIRPGLALQSAAESDEVERVVVPMGCASEGEIDLYIEPHFAKRRLVVVGFTPVAEALSRIAATLEYRVTRFVLPKEIAQVETGTGDVLALDEIPAFLAREGERTAQLAAVVASQGHYDESALERLLAVPLGFVGVLASRKRMDAMRGALLQAGVARDRLEQVHSPAGLDIGAREPGEIALAILAEIVSVVPRSVALESVAEAAPVTAGAFVDPVCGMGVDAASADASIEHAGVRYYFCCEGCARRFAAEPGRYTAALERA